MAIQTTQSEEDAFIQGAFGGGMAGAAAGGPVGAIIGAVGGGLLASNAASGQKAAARAAERARMRKVQANNFYRFLARQQSEQLRGNLSSKGPTGPGGQRNPVGSGQGLVGQSQTAVAQGLSGTF